jgi:hypothetical protein
MPKPPFLIPSFYHEEKEKRRDYLLFLIEGEQVKNKKPGLPRFLRSVYLLA